MTLSLYITLSLCAWGSPAGMPPDSVLDDRFVAMVSESRLRSQVLDLVQRGNRQGGTRSGNAAASYVFRNMRNSGLKPVRIAEPPKLAFTHLSWTLSVVYPRSHAGRVRGAVLAGFSPSVRDTTLRLIYAEVPEDLDQDEIEGHVLVTSRAVDDRLYAWLASAGAKGIISANGADSFHYSSWALMATLPASAENPIPLFTVSHRQVTRLQAALADTDSVVVRLSTRSRIAEGSPITVVGAIQGKSPEYYLVCAHGDADSGGPGADDNASGVSAVLELGRIFSSMIRNARIPQPEYGIHFAVWGSEYYSSTNYVVSQRDSLHLLRGVINFDEIGTGSMRDCIYFEPNDVPWNEPMLRIMAGVAEEHAGRPGFWDEATTNPAQGGTDSYVFLPRALQDRGLPILQIPSVTVFTAAWERPRTVEQTKGWSSTAWKGHPDSVVIDSNPYYHSLLDLPGRTTEREPFNMLWGVKAVGMTLLRLAW